MRLTIFYVILPTDALRDLAKRYNYEEAAEDDLFYTYEHDRTGREHSREQVEEAVWTRFLGNFVLGAPGSRQDNFFEECVKLGFFGCWQIIEIASGGHASVDELLDEARENEGVARENLSKLRDQDGSRDGQSRS